MDSLGITQKVKVLNIVNFLLKTKRLCYELEFLDISKKSDKDYLLRWVVIISHKHMMFQVMT